MIAHTLVEEIKKSIYNQEFLQSINRTELIKSIVRCKTIYDAEQFIENVGKIDVYLTTHTFDTLVKEGYNYNGLSEPLFKELLDTRLYIKGILTNTVYHYTKELDADFYTRVYIRVVLLKEGWSPLNIETFIKKTYGGTYDILRYKFTYMYISAILGISNVPHTKGRPSLPASIKTAIETARKDKNKKRMKAKYDISKDVTNLFTQEDISVLKEKCKENKILCSKLDVLMKYTK